MSLFKGTYWPEWNKRHLEEASFLHKEGGPFFRLTDPGVFNRKHNIALDSCNCVRLLGRKVFLGQKA